MKKGVFIILLLFLALNVSALSLSGITGWFGHLFGSGPQIVSASADPLKVKPGDQLKLFVSVKDSASIDSVTAVIPYEGGSDAINLGLIAADGEERSYLGTWIVHDTADLKWYTITVTVVDKNGDSASTTVKFQDPTTPNPGHSANQVGGGTFFGGEDYIYPASVNIQSLGRLGVGISTPQENLHVNGSVRLNNTAGNSKIEFQDSNGQVFRNITDTGATIDIRDGEPGGGVSITPPTGSASFFTLQDTAGTVKMHYDASLTALTVNGSVGANRTNPVDALEVQGVHRMRNVNATSTMTSLRLFALHESSTFTCGVQCGNAVGGNAGCLDSYIAATGVQGTCAATTGDKVCLCVQEVSG